MKQSELVSAMNRGGIFCVGTYLGGKANAINIRNKQTGASEPVTIVRETLLTDVEAVTVNRWDRTIKPEDFKPGFTKGQKVVVLVESLETQSGNKLLAGKLELLEG